MAAADFCLIPVRPSPADIEAAAPTLAAVRESGKPFAFVLNQVQPRSARLKAAAGALGESGVALKIAPHWRCPRSCCATISRMALGMAFGATEYAPCGKSAKEVRDLRHWVWTRLSCASQPEAKTNTNATLLVAPTRPRLVTLPPLAESPTPFASLN